MAILVDECIWEWRGRLWCHCVSDVSYAELHEFIKGIGVRRIAFQGDHYDLDQVFRLKAIDAGARAVSSEELVGALLKSGLRRGPRFSKRGLNGVVDLGAPHIETPRLLLRQWRSDDIPRLVELNQNVELMQLIGGVRTPEQTAKEIDDDAVLLALRGFGRWAVERKDTKEFVGRIGLRPVGFDVPYGPNLSLAWRLHPQHQNQGFATEAAREVAKYAFEILELNQLVSLTRANNRPSLRIMEKLGLTHQSHEVFDGQLLFRLEATRF
jgi:RimJ/RimL family protein N-acetyltransferase